MWNKDLPKIAISVSAVHDENTDYKTAKYLDETAKEVLEAIREHISTGGDGDDEKPEERQHDSELQLTAIKNFLNQSWQEIIAAEAGIADKDGLKDRLWELAKVYAEYRYKIDWAERSESL